VAVDRVDLDRRELNFRLVDGHVRRGKRPAKSARPPGKHRGRPHGSPAKKSRKRSRRL
jgi:hypothetical protein